MIETETQSMKMREDRHTETLTALGHPGRMAVFRLLARRAPDTVSAGELVQALGLKPSTLSVYVAILTRSGLVRQERDGRFLRYGINLENVGTLVEFLVNDCCRGRPELVANLPPGDAFEAAPQPDRIFNVLFVCTGNSTRSIFAEAILEADGGGRFRAFSAGTSPYPELSRHTLEVLQANGHDASHLQPKNLDRFHELTAPKMDFVFTVCDRAANEECPPLPGQPVSAHWGMSDPVKVEGTPSEKALAFQEAYRMLKARLEAFMALPISTLSRLSLQRELDEIGRKAT